MLVPAMAFAWCVVSVAPPPAANRVDHASAGPAVTASHESSEGGGTRALVRGPLPSEVIAFAKRLVNLPMGAEQVEEIDGQRYVFVLERHYHPPGFVGAPNGWHKGVTAYLLQ